MRVFVEVVDDVLVLDALVGFNEDEVSELHDFTFR
jgi:hypothetical protein